MTFLPRSKNLLISWLQSPSAVILEPKKIKSVTVSIVLSNPVKTVLTHLLHKDWGQGGLILWSQPRVKWGWWWLCLGPSGSSEFPKGHPEDSLVEWQGKNKKLETTFHWTFNPRRNPECIQAKNDNLVPSDTKTEHSRVGLHRGQTVQVARKGSTIRV